MATVSSEIALTMLLQLLLQVSFNPLEPITGLLGLKSGVKWLLLLLMQLLLQYYDHGIANGIVPGTDTASHTAIDTANCSLKWVPILRLLSEEKMLVPSLRNFLSSCYCRCQWKWLS